MICDRVGRSICMSDFYKDNFYTDEMISAMGGVANVDRFVEGQRKIDRRTGMKKILRKLFVAVIKLVLTLGIIILLMKIFL